MTVTLPYTFDTEGVKLTLLRGVVILFAAIVVPGIPYTLFVSHDPVGVALLAVIGAMFIAMGVIMGRFLGGSSGTITATAVDVAPTRFLGIRLPGPSGRYSMDRFSAVRVVRVSAPIDPMVQGGPHTRVYLVAKPGEPDVLVARASIDDGVAIARGLSAALQLPCEEESRPY
jgi:hypothetical protein